MLGPADEVLFPDGTSGDRFSFHRVAGQECLAIRVGDAYTVAVWLDRGLIRDPSSIADRVSRYFRFVGRVIESIAED